MKLLAKVNLLLVLIFDCSWGLTEIYMSRFLMQNARDEVIRQADLMMQGATSTRNYTAERIKPLLESELQRDIHFHPETVPAFAANRVFQYLRQGAYNDYTYRETSLNPANLTDRAVDWEADIINSFRNHSDADRIVGERDTPTGRSLFLARPMRADKNCIECHGIPAKAPKPMVRLYGATNGYGWKEGDVVAARVVSVPMAVPIAEAPALISSRTTSASRRFRSIAFFQRSPTPIWRSCQLCIKPSLSNSLRCFANSSRRVSSR